MRGFLIVIAAIGGIAVDVVAFGGRYSGAAWQIAKHQGQQLNHEAKRWLHHIDSGTGR
jgi:hypothetical protein